MGDEAPKLTAFAAPRGSARALRAVERARMPPVALALVLTAALLHALWNIAAKKAGGNHHFAFVSVVMTVVLWTPVAAWFGLNEWQRWGLVEWGVLAASALVHVLYFSVLLTGYRKADLTVVYPVARGSGPLLASVGAVLVLGEVITLVGAAGILAVCGGVFLIAGGTKLFTGSGASHANEQAHALHARAMAGVRWGAATGALIACYTVIDAYAVKVLLIGPVLVDYVGNVLRVPLLAVPVLRDRAGFAPAWRTQWRHALVVAVLGPLAYILVLYAVTMAPLSHVAPAREVSMLFAALIGGRLLGEGDRALRLVGAGCIAIGVIALAAA
jgi:drug/metabolite transporter (DMT)-like permease